MQIRPAIECEKTLLGALILDSSLLSVIKDKIAPPDFSDGFHQAIYESMLNLALKHKDFDIAMIINDLELEDDEAYLFELANNCPSTKNIEAHADIIREKSVQMKLAAVAAEIIDDAENNKTDSADTIIDRAKAKVVDIAKKYFPECNCGEEHYFFYCNCGSCKFHINAQKKIFCTECHMAVEISKVFASLKASKN